MTYDAIVIGSGIAGLNAAAAFPENKKVLILCKENSWDCNTFYAQGGVAVATDEEDIALHIEDTLAAGAGLCDEKAVEILVRDGVTEMADIIARGMEFDKDEEGNLLFTKEGAHSKNRIVHAGGDATGREIHHFLMKESKQQLLYRSTVTELLMDEGICHGVRILNDGKCRNYYAKSVIIASGGIGSLYNYHTNARTIAGEIHGLCIEKGIPLRDMEMTQFHPTVFIHNKGARKQLLTEALRGEGAHIVDESGKRFLFEYDERGELSPRSVVSKAIYDWKEKTGEAVYLSFSTFEEEAFRERFPTIYFNMKDVGFNLPREDVPISPAFHYSMGGIETDLNGKVVGCENLYAIGEAASVRVHGANRLASNSLLEGLVFSKRAVRDILRRAVYFKFKEFENECEVLLKEGDAGRKDELRSIMWNSVSIVREMCSLKKALSRIDTLLSEDIGKLLRLRLKVSKNIVESAISRTESLGAHTIKEEKK
ncbi:MAG TPA: L-aspartate oxidase [Campylobacterales bacterium]|nr:L-aspartate oxidase [Campylobacterales bacterium]